MIFQCPLVMPDSAAQAPLSTGFSRQYYWSGLPCLPPGNLPDPGIKPASLLSPALGGRFFTTRCHLGSPVISRNAYIFVLAVPLVVLRESIFTALFPCFLLHIPLQPDFHCLFLCLSFSDEPPSRTIVMVPLTLQSEN